MYDWFEENGYADEVIEPVCRMWLCEQGRVFLRPGQAYIFDLHPNCKTCKELGDHYV